MIRFSYHSRLIYFNKTCLWCLLLLICSSMEKTKNKENVTEELHPEESTVTEYRSGFSVALHLLLPVAGLIFVLFHQTNLLNKILLQIDRNCVSVFCPSFSRRERLLKWASNRLPLTWSSQSKTLSGGISDLWHDGSLLCTLINTAIPGACPNPHRHWRKPPTHAQAIAYKYFGLVPVFTDEELSSDLTPNLERNFLHYFNELQQVINKLSEKSSNINSYSEKYIPRGMGLFSGEQHRQVTFYVYQDENIKTENESTVIVQIRGPYGTYGQAIIPRFHDSLFKVPDVKVMTDFASTTKFKSKTHFMQSFAISFLRYQKKHMGDNIVIDITMEEDRAKVTYIPKNYGMYEINMVANGELLKGSPFNVHILKNTLGIEENFEGEETIKPVSAYRKKKVLSHTIDKLDGKETPQQENSLKLEVKNTKKLSDSPKNSILRFADIINGTDTNDTGVQREKHIEPHVGFHNEKFEYDEIHKEDEQTVSKNPIISIISTIEEETEEVGSMNHDEESSNVETEKLYPEFVNLEQEKRIQKLEDVNKTENSPVSLKNDLKNKPEAARITKLLEIEPDLKKTITTVPYEDKLVTKNINKNELEEHKKHEKYCEKGKTIEHLPVPIESLATSQNASCNKEETRVTEGYIQREIESEVGQISSNHNLTYRRYSPPSVKLKEYSTRAKINTLKIPDKFVSDKGIFHKDLKNLINSSSKNRTTDFLKNNQKTLLLKNISTQKNDTDLKQVANNNNNNNNTVFRSLYDKEINKEIPVEQENKQNDQLDQLKRSEWSPNGNVKKLLKNYQQKPSVSINFTKNNIVGNLHQKIKLPQDIDINREHVIRTEQKPAIRKTIPTDAASKTNLNHFKSTLFKFSSNLDKNMSQSNPSELNTSPICSDHIVPEVDYRQMSVAEKRKIFAQSTIEGHTSSNCSSSENENDEKNVKKSKNNKHLQFEGLSVMNVLGSLKKSENSEKSNLYQNSAASLPNITDLPDEYVFPQVVKEKKHFWEEVSSRSSSSLSTTHSVKNKSLTKRSSPEKSIEGTYDKDTNRKTSIVGISDSHRSAEDLTMSSYGYSSLNYSTEEEMNYSLPNMSLDSDYPISISVKERKFYWEKFYPRSSSSLGDEAVRKHQNKDVDQRLRALWSKPQETPKPNLVERSGGIYKSENNILSLDNFHSHSLKKYKSVDDSLDNCTVVSLEERKKMLLKTDCFKTVSDKSNIVTKFKKSVPVKESEEDATATVSHVPTDLTGHKTNSHLKETSEIVKEIKQNPTDSSNTTSTKMPSSHSHFRKAIKYFKTLEAKSHRKSVLDRPKKLTEKKKFSLEVNRNRSRKMGGSLNVPNLSNKFALYNIYDDVFGRGRVTFKGVPNRSALVEALATFSRKDEIEFYRNENEDDIRFDLFKRKMKSKKRTSLKSVFDICY